jgi:hypothetical protein
VLPPSEPVADNVIVHLVDAPSSIPLDKRTVRSPLWMFVDSLGRANNGSVVQRSQKSRTVMSLARPSPKRSRPLSRARLASVFVANVPGPPRMPETLRSLARLWVVDLRSPTTGRELYDAHVALPRSDAQEIAMDGLKRRVRLPHVTDGIPSATMRSTVARLTPMIAASSARAT